MHFIGLYVKKDDLSKVTKTTRKPGKKVLFVGNSWTQATLGTKIPYKGNDTERYNTIPVNAAPRRYNSYINTITDALGFECINDGAGGTGYSVPINGNEEVWSQLWYNNRIKFMIEKGVTPDIIVVGGAGNDILLRADNPQKVAEEAQKCIDTVKTLNAQNNTNMKLIIIGVERVTGGLREEFDKSAEPMNKALKEVALKNNIPFIDFTTNTTIASDNKTITDGKTPFVLPEYIGADNLHPTLEGYEKIGLRLAEEMQTLLNYEGWNN